MLTPHLHIYLPNRYGDNEETLKKYPDETEEERTKRKEQEKRRHKWKKKREKTEGKEVSHETDILPTFTVLLSGLLACPRPRPRPRPFQTTHSLTNQMHSHAH